MREPSVIDAHIHFWDPGRLPYPWLDTQPELRRPFRPEHLRPGPVRIEGVVVVEADCQPPRSVAEVEWMLGLSSPGRPVLGVVAAAALESPTAVAELEVLSRRQEVKGIRRLLQDTSPGFCLEPAFVSAVASLARWGLAFDLCVREHQLAEATALVRQCPEVIFVLDHLGKPSVQAIPARDWVVDIEQLARLPNARCKLSGLTTEVRGSGHSAGTAAIFQPYLDHALQTFGPGRCMFGSDWPLASLNVTYDGWVDHVLATLAPFSAADTELVMHQVAADVYRLGEST